MNYQRWLFIAGGALMGAGSALMLLAALVGRR